MRARAPAASSVQALSVEERNRWVNVTWMPHASLSQTSHVSFAVRSVLTSLDEMKYFKKDEWQVRATIHGVAGLALVPVPSSTATYPVTKIRPTDEQVDGTKWVPLVSGMTHACTMDTLVHIPLRWRDLPRDSYLKLEVVGHHDEVVSDCSFTFFPRRQTRFRAHKLTFGFLLPTVVHCYTPSFRCFW